MELISNYYTVNGVQLHVMIGGNNTSPAVLFLHGFPSFWIGWKKQIPYFLSKNYFVIVPDQRGYNKSSKPLGIKSYRLSLLVDDMAGLLALLGVKKTYVVSHDWGGIIAWSLAKKFPYLCNKIVVINAPYLPAYAKNWRKQILKSWYVYFFQLPSFPEWSMKRHHFFLLRRSPLSTSLPQTFSAEDIDQYKEAWTKPGALKAMINWYRALVKYTTDAKEIFTKRKLVEMPVLVLWGAKDKFLHRDSGICPAKHCTEFYLIEYEDATHWLPLEKSEWVNETIQHFFKKL